MRNTMKTLVLGMAATFAVSLSACGDDAGNACEAAGTKIMNCWKGLDCTKLDEPYKTICETMKNPPTVTVTVTATGDTCTGAALTEAEKINKCTLSTDTSSAGLAKLCQCK